MRYSELLHGSNIICLPLNIPEKLHWQHLFEKPEKAETHRLYFSQYNTIPTHPEKQHLPFKLTGTNTIFSFVYQSCTLPSSDPFCWQNPYSGCNSGIDLVIVLEYTFFQNLNHLAVVLTKHCQSYTAFLLYVRCSKWSRSFFYSWLPPMIVRLRNLFLLNTPVARMLLNLRWVGRRKDMK